jgi:hypothetical protein
MKTTYDSVAALAVALLAGCGVGPRAEPLNEELAGASLKAALEAWKRGDPPRSLENASPPVIAQDQDWLAGARLVDYEPAGDGRRTADNLFAPVKLRLKTRAGKAATKTVTYVIGTSPHVMVVRMPRDGPPEGGR